MEGMVFGCDVVAAPGSWLETSVETTGIIVDTTGTHLAGAIDTTAMIVDTTGMIVDTTMIADTTGTGTDGKCQAS
jgi:hypothetical protein